jgi:gamma-glutamylcysteine synthetase
MAVFMVKSTYVLDVETAETLDRLAREWQVSKSEALRRAIRSAGTAAAPDGVTIFRKLQQAVHLDRAGADRWADAVRAERRTDRRGAAAAARPRRQRFTSIAASSFTRCGRAQPRSGDCSDG